jgi:hypothetical protein
VSASVDDAADALQVPAETLEPLAVEPPAAAARHVARIAPDDDARETALAWLEAAHPEVDA